MKSSADLKKFLDENNIKAEILDVPNTKTAKLASVALGMDRNIVAKSVVFAAKNKAVVAVILGSDRADFQKLRQAAGETCNTASPEEVLKYTGYKAGGVPPVSSGVDTYIDKKVIELDVCYAGGGDENHLIRISPKDILKYSKGKVADIALNAKHSHKLSDSMESDNIAEVRKVDKIV